MIRKSIYVKAILIGYIATMVVALAVGGLSTYIPLKVRSIEEFALFLYLAESFFISTIGGYIVGRFAKGNKIFNAVLFVFFSILMDMIFHLSTTLYFPVVEDILAKLEELSGHNMPYWVEIIEVILRFPGAYVGGLFALKKIRKI